MQSKRKGGPRVIEIESQLKIFSVLFSEDSKQVLSGGVAGVLRRWQVDAREVGKPVRTEGAEIYAAALSSDRRWLACGLRRLDAGDGKTSVRVWDAQTHEKVLDIQGHKNAVFSVDISADSMKLVTGSSDKTALIFNLTTGEKLTGPLNHDGWVVAVRFSPAGDRIATATASENQVNAKSIRIFSVDNGQQLLNIPFGVKPRVSSPLAWSADGSRLFAVSYGQVKCFETTESGLLLSPGWSVPGGGSSASIALSSNDKFAVVATSRSLSFWDTFSCAQIENAIQHASSIWSIALSPNNHYLAIGEENGRVTLRNLHDILPVSYLSVNVSNPNPLRVDLDGLIVRGLLSFSLFILPHMCISDAAFQSWDQGDLTRAEDFLSEEIIHPSDISHYARALAQRALVRARLKQWDTAIDDAKKSVEIQRSVVGYIAMAVAYIGNNDHESSIRAFDLVFSDGFQDENNSLLLIKAIILFECGNHNDAISRVKDLINIVEDQSQYVAVLAQMHLRLAILSMRKGENERAIELLNQTKNASPFVHGPHIVVVSLFFGWDFGHLTTEIQLHLFKAMYTLVETLGEGELTSDMTADWDPDTVEICLTTFENNGDLAVESNDLERAIAQYSAALSLNPSNRDVLLVKRSKARVMLGLVEEALRDADEAVIANPTCPWGHERRHAALHVLQRYDEAINAFTHMFSLIGESNDQNIRQLGKKYVSPTQSESSIDDMIHGVFKTSPLVLIDVKSGRLCDGPSRTHTFKSEPQFKELRSSITEKLNNEDIKRVVEDYFQYIMLSHVWEREELSFQDVVVAGSIWGLDPSPLSDKLRKFCEAVRTNGYRWAWCDTCCVDKAVSTVLHQSLKMMYKWYEGSAATFVFLRDVDWPLTFGALVECIWMTRAWTAQELLATKVIRFYDRKWKPYLGDTVSNHKELPEIMEELTNALGIARETIVAFNPDSLSIKEKLRLASKRNATIDEDIAYSLIGIFKSDIIPCYGEGDAALGHLLEEIVARSGEVTVLSWAGKSSTYNSCLPVSLTVYGRPPYTPPSIDDIEMEAQIEELRPLLPAEDAISIYDRVVRLPPARFANRRLHLPCIVFRVNKVSVQTIENNQEICYRARIAAMGDVDFWTSDTLSLTKPRKLVFVHPWISQLHDPLDGFGWNSSVGGADGNGDESPSNSESGDYSEYTSEDQSAPSTPPNTDRYSRALRLAVHLQHPFHVLLLQQRPDGVFKRVAAEHDIVMPGINFPSVVRTEVLQIL